MIWLRVGGLAALIATGWLVWWLIGDNAVLRAETKGLHDEIRAIAAEREADSLKEQEISRYRAKSCARIADDVRRLSDRAAVSPARSGSANPGDGGAADAIGLIQACAETNEALKELQEAIRLKTHAPK